MARRRRARGRRGHGDHENEERWLLTYADMITLLMALFMVLFSISSVNKSKLETLQHALQDAFSGQILPGGRALENAGGTDSVRQSASSPPYPNLQQVMAKAQAAQEDQAFQALKRSIDRQARAEGVAAKVSTRVSERGLEIEILTDGLLFDSGQARIKPAGEALLRRLGPLLERERVHRILVEGHTDSLPIAGSVYPSNWELSTARASAVVRALVAQHVAPERFEASGRAYLDPVGSNATPQGRARNRRVEIVLPRRGAS